MPDPHLLPAFVLAVTALLLTPGPNFALIVANSLAHGPRRGMLTALATASASMVQLLLVSAGMASVVSRLGDWFELFRWAGVLYLLYMGVQQWRAPAAPLVAAGTTGHDLRRTFARAATVSILNPKTLLFYAAFFPQFIAPDRPVAPQLAVLAVLYLMLAIVIDCLWALGAGRLRGLLGQRSRVFNRLSGGVLIGAGIGLAVKH